MLFRAAFQSLVFSAVVSTVALAQTPAAPPKPSTQKPGPTLLSEKKAVSVEVTGR